MRGSDLGLCGGMGTCTTSIGIIPALVFDTTWNISILQEGGQVFKFHLMKGPMTTQSLRGLANLEPYQWRGGKPDLAAFNGAFAALLSGTQHSDAEMGACTNFVNTLVHQPNPNLNVDGSYPAAVKLADYPCVSASPSDGYNIFGLCAGIRRTDGWAVVLRAAYLSGRLRSCLLTTSSLESSDGLDTMYTGRQSTRRTRLWICGSGESAEIESWNAPGATASSQTPYDCRERAVRDLPWSEFRTTVY